MRFLSILMMVCFMAALPADAYRAGPRAQTNFKGKKDPEAAAAAATGGASKTRTFTTYGSDRKFTHPTAGGEEVAPVAATDAAKNKGDERTAMPEINSPAMNALGGGTTTTNFSSSAAINATKGSGVAAALNFAQQGAAAAQVPAAAQTENGAPADPNANPAATATAAMPDMSVLQQMDSLKNLMPMMTNMSGGGAAAPAAGGAAPAAGGTPTNGAPATGMPAGMPDISALLNSMGGLGGGAPKK